MSDLYKEFYDPKTRADRFVYEFETNNVAELGNVARNALRDAVEEMLKVVIYEMGFREPDETKGEVFIDNGIDPEDLEPFFCEAMGELTRRRAYSKSECAQLIAEKAKVADNLLKKPRGK